MTFADGNFTKDKFSTRCKTFSRKDSMFNMQTLERVARITKGLKVLYKY